MVSRKEDHLGTAQLSDPNIGLCLICLDLHLDCASALGFVKRCQMYDLKKDVWLSRSDNSYVG